MNNKKLSKTFLPELLLPAPSLSGLKTALFFGADAVYLGGEAFSLRAKAQNFTMEEMREGISYAHAHKTPAHPEGAKVYVAANIIPHNKDIEEAEAYFRELRELSPDGILVADPGMLLLAKEICPEIPLHLSTQANSTNYRTFSFWQAQGVSRIVAARELSLQEIWEIRGKIPETLEIEAFVHGAMCVSYSGRCLISAYLNHRSANMGLCTHPCRWEYNNVRYGNAEMSPACGNKAIQKNTYENVPEKERQGRLSEKLAAYAPDTQNSGDFRVKVGNDDQILTKKRQAKMVFGQSEGRLSEKPIAYVPHSQNPGDFWAKVGNSNQILVTGQAKVDSDERSEIVFERSEGENCLPAELAITYGEKGRPGEEFSAIENERGTFLFHSKDLCMIRHLPELVEAGISSLKIEGRNKNQLYVAQCARAYRIALDTYFRLGYGMKHFDESHSQSEAFDVSHLQLEALAEENNNPPFDFSFSEEYGKVIAECEKQLIECAARPFSTGFYFGSPDQESQIYEDAPVSRVAFLGEIIETAFLPDNPQQIEVVFYQKNKFGVGDEIFVVCPEGDLPCRVEAMYDEEGNAISACPHPNRRIRCRLTCTAVSAETLNLGQICPSCLLKM